MPVFVGRLAVGLGVFLRDGSAFVALLPWLVVSICDRLGTLAAWGLRSVGGYFCAVAFLGTLQDRSLVLRQALFFGLSRTIVTRSVSEVAPATHVVPR